MKLGIFSVNDKLIGYKTPFVEMNSDAAVRNFTHCVETEYGGEVHSPLFDQSLYQLGNFDSVTGIIESFDTPQFLTSAILIINTLNVGGDSCENE